MAGANYVLDKGFAALATYASSDVNGVEAYRFVKLTGQDQIDRQTAANLLSVGVVQEDVDQAKVATGKAVVDVRLMGISKVRAGGNVTIGTEVMSDTQGRAVTAATTGNRVVGIALQGGASGDLIDVLLIQGGRLIP